MVEQVETSEPLFFCLLGRSHHRQAGDLELRHAEVLRAAETGLAYGSVAEDLALLSV